MSRPMALQEVEFDGDLWFFTARDSRKASHVGTEPQVNVTVSSRSVWVSLTGSAAVVDDQSKKTELWNAGIEAWRASPTTALSAWYWANDCSSSSRERARPNWWTRLTAML